LRRLYHSLTWVVPSPHTRSCAGVDEHHQLGREWAFVRQDPRAGSHDVEVRRLVPRARDRVGRQRRLVGVPRGSVDGLILELVTALTACWS